MQPLLQRESSNASSDFVIVALGIQHAMRMCAYCHLLPVRLYNIVPHFS